MKSVVKILICGSSRQSSLHQSTHTNEGADWCARNRGSLKYVQTLKEYKGEQYATGNTKGGWSVEYI